jgi:hypothetical protein
LNVVIVITLGHFTTLTFTVGTQQEALLYPQWGCFLTKTPLTQALGQSLNQHPQPFDSPRVLAQVLAVVVDLLK